MEFLEESFYLQKMENKHQTKVWHKKLYCAQRKQNEGWNNGLWSRALITLPEESAHMDVNKHL